MFIGVAYGTGVGMVLDLFILMYSMARPGIKVVEPLTSEQMTQDMHSTSQIQVIIIIIITIVTTSYIGHFTIRIDGLYIRALVIGPITFLCQQPGRGFPLSF